jgi:DNA-binding transcriptional regulator GbsR (MarR family)
MIPGIKEILTMLKNGDCTIEQAQAWLADHLEQAERDGVSRYLQDRKPGRTP